MRGPVRSVSLFMLALTACAPKPKPTRAALDDSAFRAVQARGRNVMGVDQYTSAHVFEDLPDGGRIVLDRAEPGDSAGIATIRAHMRDIAANFTRGDFTRPFAVHATAVPGAATMAAMKDRIRYQTIDRPAGAEVRIHTGDATAVKAVHEFLAFQRSDHRAAGHEEMNHSAHSAPP